MSQSPLRRILPLAAAAALILAPSLGAQAAATSDPLQWEVGAATSGWCVYFLMEGTEAQKDLTRGHRLVLASEAKNLPRALQQAIAEDPKYADWVPSELCTYYVEAVWSGGRRFDKGDKNTPMALIYWGVAAAEGQSAWDGEMSLKVAGTNSFPLTRWMEVQGLHIDRIPIDRDPDPVAPEDSQYVIKMEGATITFIGHMNPDSVTPPAPRQATGVFNGPVNSVWKMSFSYTPERMASLGGSLKIVGKRDLAKALNASPIRLLGASVVGGKGAVGFSKSQGGKK